MANAHDHFEFISWRTRDATTRIDQLLAERLAEAFRSYAEREETQVLEMAILPNHVHLLVALGAGVLIPRLVQRLKGATSRLAKRDRWSDVELNWQSGYDSRSAGRDNFGIIRQYLDDQPRKHGLPLLLRWSSEQASQRAA